MEESSPVHLHLRAPLEYMQAAIIPFACQISGGEGREDPANLPADELLFCFELDREQAGLIDPQADCFPGELVFAGRSCHGETASEMIQLPAGLYLFVQRRKALNREECIAMAIEQQKDGVWEQLKLENRLYIRCLFEDGSPVTQLFRRYSD